MAKRHRIPLSDREIAGHFLMALSRHRHRFVCIDQAYDDDADFLDGLSKKLGLQSSFPWKSFQRRLQGVCRRLESGCVLSGELGSCHAEYMGEPRVLKEYKFSNPSYAFRLAPDKYPHYNPEFSPEIELRMLLDRAFGIDAE